MDIHCNVSTLASQTQMDSSLYHLIEMVIMCVSCSLNTILSLPLVWVITRSPSLLRHTRFLLLAHLLLCDSLQVDFLLSTAMAVDRFVAVKWPLRYELLIRTRRKRAAVTAMWAVSFVAFTVALGISLSNIKVNLSFQRCRPLILMPCLSETSAALLYCTLGSAVVLPLCSLTILGCFCLLCRDMHAGLLCSKRAWVTLTLQAVQTLLFSVPVIMEGYLIPAHLHSDAVDIASTITYNLGVSLIPLVYGYRSRELQQRIRQAALMCKVLNLT